MATKLHEKMEPVLKKANEMGWYSVPCWYLGEGILIDNEKYPNGSILPYDYTPDIIVPSNGGIIFGYPFKLFITLFFAKKYRPVVQFKFGGKILRGIGSAKYMNWVTKENIAAYKGRAGVVSILYEDNNIQTFYADIIEGKLNNPNPMLNNFNEVLNSRLFDENASYHYIINKDCIEHLPHRLDI